MARRLHYFTHPRVVIDPSVPVGHRGPNAIAHPRTTSRLVHGFIATEAFATDSDAAKP